MSIWEKYKPIIVMVPSLVALHYGWFWLQGNESIYPQKYGPKLEEQPIVTVSAPSFAHKRDASSLGIHTRIHFCTFADSETILRSSIQEMERNCRGFIGKNRLISVFHCMETMEKTVNGNSNC